MSQFCERCRQVCDTEETSCPRCGIPVLTAVAGADVTPTPIGQLNLAGPATPRRKSDSDVDLGGPLPGTDDLAGPPSGASFVSWVALVQPPIEPVDNQVPVMMGSASSARILLDPIACVPATDNPVDRSAKVGSLCGDLPGGGRLASGIARTPVGQAAARGSYGWVAGMLFAILAAAASLALGWSARHPADPFFDRPTPSPDHAPAPPEASP